MRFWCRVLTLDDQAGDEESLFRQPMRFELSVCEAHISLGYFILLKISTPVDVWWFLQRSSLYTQLAIAEGVSWSFFFCRVLFVARGKLGRFSFAKLPSGYLSMRFQGPSDSGSPGQLNDSDALLISIVSSCLGVATWPTLLAWPYGWIGSSSAIAGRYRRPPKETRDW